VHDEPVLHVRHAADVKVAVQVQLHEVAADPVKRCKLFRARLQKSSVSKYVGSIVQC
jgi:hypothetical protein